MGYNEAYMYAVAAGANPMEAALLAAIAGPESGYNANAFNGNARTGDQSYGLWQINMLGSLGPARRAEFGISSNDQLFDPVTNARAALSILHGQGPNAWTAYKNGSYQKYMQGVPAGASAGPPVNGAAGPVGGAPPTATYHVPAGGTVTTVNGGYASVMYQVASNVWIYFALDQGNIDTSNLPRQNLSGEQWAAMAPGLVAGGSAAELNSIAQDYGHWWTYWRFLLDTHLGPNSEAMNDPGVIKVMAQVAARPDMSPAEITNLIKQTDYWKNRTEGQNQWNDFSPAEQAKRIEDVKTQLQDQYFQLVGAQFPTQQQDVAAQLLWWSTLVATGQKDINSAILNWVKPIASLNPESPWSRTMRTEQENQRQRGVDIENQVQSVKELARKWGFQSSDDQLKQWGQDIVEKKMSDSDLTNLFATWAHGLFPWMDQADPSKTQDTETLAQPWLQTYARVMEKPADVLNSKVQEALSNATPPWQFEKELKMTPDWLQTKNGQAEITQAVGDVGGKMGFV